ncbi:MAG: C39 family peptidase [Parcubacteria group bacterium]|jgi:hypothetical protein
MKKILITIALIFILLGGYLINRLLTEEGDAPSIVPEAPTLIAPPTAERPAVVNPNRPESASETKAITKTIKLDVPFVLQAPFGNWSDPIFQNACEEASIVMAMGWLKGTKTISPDEAQKQILEIVDFENKTFGYNTDTDAADVARIFQQFFQWPNVATKENITIADIKSELQQGHLVILPVFGQALGNPNFTAPGPIAHMLPVIGYDPATREFITNDPGTRRGANYRYTERVLFDAIWNYGSGKDMPPAPTGVREKTMIVVTKE